MPEIRKTADGSHTIYVPELDEHYHSVHGAIQESEFIFIGCGLNFSKKSPIRIFEAGFGTGLNALLTCIYASANEREILYTSIEKYPLSDDIIDSLNYKDLSLKDCGKLFKQMHSCEWNIQRKITNHFTLLKINGDLITDDIPGIYDLIYFDAFGPDKQPEMWTDEIFRKISDMTERTGILVTYSVKGKVKRTLKKYGFDVNLLPGPPGKRQILRAVKI
jgi:tRNA U34 5-methylaminomethyl-2-thiouridine-forming methyltransferase MnmC